MTNTQTSYPWSKRTQEADQDYKKIKLGILVATENNLHCTFYKGTVSRFVIEKLKDEGYSAEYMATQDKLAIYWYGKSLKELLNK